MPRAPVPLQIDDRLGTVMRARPGTTGAARTQFRQLLDLLGTRATRLPDPDGERALDRLDALAELLPAADLSAILRDAGTRLRNPHLVQRLAHAQPQVAAAAMATARLDQHAWLAVIPALPLTARGFLRHRRDLPDAVRDLLHRLGVGDLALPPPAQPAGRSASDPAPPAADGVRGIGDLVRRIEAFRKQREAATAPPSPLHDPNLAPARPLRDRGPQCIDFITDAGGGVRWTEPSLAPLLIGMVLLPQASPFAPLRDRQAQRAVRDRQPLKGETIELSGPEGIAGKWQIDAAPRFSDMGAFRGYCGRLRRPAVPAATGHGPDPEADRMRQVLHELRTPVNAIQGFAEIIQQQLFGAVPNEYRALSAAIAVDAARLLGGFEELDRLARIETGALELPQGACDIAQVIGRQVRRLDGILRPRSAAIEVHGPASLAVAMAEDDAALLVWRLLASVAGALAPGERISITLHPSARIVTADIELPIALDGLDDLFDSGPPAQARIVSAGMFGTGFALRLARAEAAAAGGTMERSGEKLTLSLPVVWHKDALDPPDDAQGGTSAA